MAAVERIFFPFLPWLPGISKLKLLLRYRHRLSHLRVLTLFLFMVMIFLTVPVLWGDTFVAFISSDSFVKVGWK